MQRLWLCGVCCCICPRALLLLVLAEDVLLLLGCHQGPGRRCLVSMRLFLM